MQKIIITGGGKRMGRELAKKFKSSGWYVIITYNNTPPKDDSYYDASYKVNLKNSNEIELFFDDIKKYHNDTSVLLNNAGVFPKIASLTETSEAVWDETNDINLKAAFLTSKYFSNAVKAGMIINIASLGGLEIWKGRIPYNVSKSGLITLTKALARELAPDFSVNCICPGTILLEDEPVEEALKVEYKIPMQRHGSIEDIFEAIYFFATCSKFITGQTLNVDGGYHLIK